MLDSCVKLNVTTFISVGSLGRMKEQMVFMQGKLCDKADVELRFQAVAVVNGTINGTIVKLYALAVSCFHGGNFFF